MISEPEPNDTAGHRIKSIPGFGLVRNLPRFQHIVGSVAWRLKGQPLDQVIFTTRRDDCFHLFHANKKLRCASSGGQGWLFGWSQMPAVRVVMRAHDFLRRSFWFFVGDVRNQHRALSGIFRRCIVPAPRRTSTCGPTTFGCISHDQLTTFRGIFGRFIVPVAPRVTGCSASCCCCCCLLLMLAVGACYCC